MTRVSFIRPTNVNKSLDCKEHSWCCGCSSSHEGMNLDCNSTAYSSRLPYTTRAHNQDLVTLAYDILLVETSNILTAFTWVARNGVRATKTKKRFIGRGGCFEQKI